ncbi:uncharacterized protein LOC113237161 [Hyposmocoma kahamanoa]|uniref:uncharacterized protein LOC113237161 n=1 Tax=Hyposmocoma kahamanoa TaxID=1477025 RepID=UPI000E6D75CC|nr:uncharacterized protein LOC113237161 [Hyposmocoma kahamanoa]
MLALFCYAHNKISDVQIEIENWLTHLHLLYTRDYLENVKSDPEKYITLGISLTIIYSILCVLYIYGAYTCKNYLMIGFILAELMRLLVVTMAVATWLLVLKQNTMDIGLLIGASVAGGFFLLGMFYLWVCAANLPVLINEMEQDEKIATIEKLQQMLESKQRPYNRAPNQIRYMDNADTAIFTLPRNKKHVVEQPFVTGSRIPVSFNR